MKINGPKVHAGGHKPVSEHKAVQHLKGFTGDRRKFREWNEKLLNALAQVDVRNRKVLKTLNKKLETLDGALQDTDDEDLCRILNDRLTQSEYRVASPAERTIDDNKGEYDFTEKDMFRLSEDLWYILNDKLEGQDPLGKLKGLKEGQGLTAYQKVYKWYFAVTGVTLKAKTNLAMNPDKPKKVTDVSTQLEQWTALVESLETYGPSYSLGLPFRVTALQVIMHHASEWFDSWQSECYKTPDALTIDSYQKLYQKCEDWARKKRLGADAHNVNMEISGVDGSKSSEEDDGYFDENGNWWDYDGNCWPVNVEGEANEVS